MGMGLGAKMMRVVVVGALLVVCFAQLVVGAGGEDEGWEWDGDKIQCGKKPLGRYYYPNDKSKMIKCTRGPSGEKAATVYPCPPGGTFSLEKDGCYDKDGKGMWICGSMQAERRKLLCPNYKQ